MLPVQEYASSLLTWLKRQIAWQSKDWTFYEFKFHVRDFKKQNNDSKRRLDSLDYILIYFNGILLNTLNNVYIATEECASF